MLKNPIALPLERLAPDENLFLHDSTLHGQGHVARVMVLGFVLVDRLSLPMEAARLWAASYLHDLARVHDGRCYEHGRRAVDRLARMPEVRALFSLAGVGENDYEAVGVAVANHSVPQELPKGHPHWRLTALLKDADGLDRVRLGDLDPDYLRFEASQGLVGFAQALYDSTAWSVAPGPGYLARIWPAAQDLAIAHGI